MLLAIAPSLASLAFPATLIQVMITAGRAHAFFINRMLATLAHVNFLLGCATLALPLVVVGVVSTAVALVAECALLVGEDIGMVVLVHYSFGSLGTDSLNACDLFGGEFSV
jgi:hypothetical protein